MLMLSLILAAVFWPLLGSWLIEPLGYGLEELLNKVEDIVRGRAEDVAEDMVEDIIRGEAEDNTAAVNIIALCALTVLFIILKNILFAIRLVSLTV